LSQGPLHIGSMLFPTGIVVLSFAYAFFVSERGMSRAIAGQRRASLEDREEDQEAEKLRKKYREEHPELVPQRNAQGESDSDE